MTPVAKLAALCHLALEELAPLQAARVIERYELIREQNGDPVTSSKIETSNESDESDETNREKS